MAVQRLGLAASVNEREPGDTKDTRLKNCYKETVPEMQVATQSAQEKGSNDTVYVTKRPGLKLYDNLSAATSDVGRGITNWEGRIYTILGAEVFSDETNILDLSTSTGRLSGFDIANDAEVPAEDTLVFHDGSTIYAVDDENTMLKIGDEAGDDVDLEIAAFIPGIQVIGTYTFVADSIGNIYNSEVGDVSSWSEAALTAPSTNMELRADAAVALGKYIQYLVGFGEETTSFFYLDGTDGSPISPFEGAHMLIGCAAGHTVVNCGTNLLWVARRPDGGRFVAMLGEAGFQHRKVSTDAIDGLLEKEGSNISNAYAFYLNQAGHEFYILTLPTTAQRTFVYDIMEKNWYEFTSDVEDTESYFTGMDSAHINGTNLILDEDNGLVYDFDEEQYDDETVVAEANGETIKVEIRTMKHDGGNMQNKFLSRLQILGDLNSSSGTINVAWSDDDYQNFSTNRTQDLDNHQSWLTRCGMFKRRAFRIQHQQALPMRLSAMELNVEQGHYGRS